jgi:transcriptional regulator with XRE-family HTH domain
MARSRRRASPSSVSLELARRVRELRQSGVSTREIARRSGISKSQISNIELGKRNASEQTATAALEKLGSEENSERRVAINGEWQLISPAHARDFSKVARFQQLLGQTHRTADYRLIRRTLSKSQLTVKILGEGGRTKTVILDADPDNLRRLDDAGLLAATQVRIGASPNAGMRAAA